MAGWLDGLFNNDPPGGLFAFLRAASNYPPGAGRLPVPRPAGRRAEEEVYPPPMPEMPFVPWDVPGSGGALPGSDLPMIGQAGRSSGFPPVVTPQEAAFRATVASMDADRSPFGTGVASAPYFGSMTPTAGPPEVPPAPFDMGAPATPYMFGPGLPSAAPPPPSALPARSAPPSPVAAGAQDAALPATSAPTSGVAPGAPASPNILGTIGRHILQGLQDNSNALIAGGGATMSGGLGRGFSAFAAASPLDVAARKERQANEATAATYQAVLQQQLSRGVAPTEARANALAASQNKEILTTLMGPQFQKAEVKGIGGDVTPVAFDPRTGRYTSEGKPIGAATPTSGELPTGQEYLDKYVPKNAHAIIKAAANYDVPISGLGTLKQLQPHILNYDPAFDASNYAAKVALKKNYLSGKNYEELKAYEKIGNHLNTLKQAVENLDPSQVVGFNSLRNMFSDYGVNNPKVITLRNAMNAVNHELGNAYHANHITNATLHAFQQNINDTMSVPGFKAGIGTMSELIHGIITSNENAFNNALPGEKGPKEFRALSEGTRQKFKDINDWALGMEAPKNRDVTQSAAPPGTKVGERKQFKQGWGVWNGQAWVPEK